MANLDIPAKLLEKLAQNSKLKSAVETSITNFQDWINDNKLVFFPEYTDHGMNHLQEVLDSAQGLISESSWSAISPEDVAAIVLSILLHDCALHLSEDGFYELINDEYPKVSSRYVDDQESWKVIWSEFLEEAKRFDDNRLISLFGKKVIIHEVPNDKGELTLNHRLLIGEFLRRHHARLAHEIAFNGIPNGRGFEEKIKLASTVSSRFYDLVGFIAKSHNLSLRNAIERLHKNNKQSDQGIHVPFVMAILRVADYIQIHSDRAPSDLLKVKKLISPVSRGEWNKHHSIDQIHNNHEDPEAIFIDAEPLDAITYESLINLFTDIQKELDISWSILGEIYGRYKDLNFGLNIRRIRSSLDNKNDFIEDKKITYIPEVFRFRTAHSELMELLIKPLYGNNPSIGIRELLQNAVDATKERINLERKNLIPKVNKKFTIELILKKRDEKYQFIIKDDGLGMDQKVVRDYFLNVGASYRKSDLWSDSHKTNGKSDISRIGRFGVGILAAYLLGDEIQVQTRSVNELDQNKGLVFNCNNFHKPITINYKNCNIGTTIIVNLTKKTYDLLSKKVDEWDWYYLNDVVVKRFHDKDGEITEINDEKNIDFNSYILVRSSSPCDIKWSYKNYKSMSYYRRTALLICNGIYISGSGYFDNKFNLNDYNDNIVLNKPTLIVNDNEGIFPLNLQRTEVIDTPDFITDLKKSIYCNIVKNIKNESIDSMIDRVVGCNIDKYLYGVNKKIFFEISIFPLLDINRLCYFSQKENSSSAEVDINWFSEKNTFFTKYSVDKGILSNISFLRSIFLDGVGAHYNDSLYMIARYSGRKIIFIERKLIESYVGKGKYPPTYWESLYKQDINEKWVLVSNIHKKVQEKDFNFVEIIKYLDSHNCNYFVSFDFEWSKEKIDLTDFAKIYQEEYPDFNLI